MVMVAVMDRIIMANKAKVVGIKVKVAGVLIMEILVMETIMVVVVPVVQSVMPIIAIEVKDHMVVSIF